MGLMNSALAKGEIDQSTIKEQEQTIKANAVQAWLQTTLTKANIEYTEQKVKYYADEIAAMYINAYASQRNANAAETNSFTGVEKQVQEYMYQRGLLELGDRKLDQDLIFGTIDILAGSGGQRTQIRGFK